MRKSLFFAVAGAGIILAGCNAEGHRHTMIPVDDVQYGDNKAVPAPQKSSAEKTLPEPEAVPAPKKQRTSQAVKRYDYAPMTGAVSSGGVDSVSVKPGKKSNKSGKTVAPGGTYVVQRGDTPERIARKHKVRLSALMSANNLTEDSARKLQIGQKLVIPGGSGIAKSGKTEKKSAAAPVATESKAEKGKYKVQRGDTPERIARRHKVRVRELLAANNLNDDSARKLQIGQILIIPGNNTAVVEKTNNKNAESSPVPPAPVPAKKTDGTVSSAANTDKKTEVESDTSAADFSADATVLWEATEDTTFAKVAALHNISEETLRTLNDAGAGQNIAKGDLIYVPKNKQ